jgi:vacuolar-type H+-ATPase subunit B/Vma2
MGVNTELACFFCSNFDESRAMQRMTLFLNPKRERLPALIVTGH